MRKTYLPELWERKDARRIKPHLRLLDERLSNHVIQVHANGRTMVRMSPIATAFLQVLRGMNTIQPYASNEKWPYVTTGRIMQKELDLFSFQNIEDKVKVIRSLGSEHVQECRTRTGGVNYRFSAYAALLVAAQASVNNKKMPKVLRKYAKMI